MKAYTDIEQSQKLVEILPKETADFHFKYYSVLEGWCEIPHYGTVSYIKDLPCWSLAALLDILKDDIKIEKTLFDQSNMFTYSILGDAYEYRTYEHEELIDACVEMLIKLHELKML